VTASDDLTYDLPPEGPISDSIIDAADQLPDDSAQPAPERDDSPAEPAIHVPAPPQTGDAAVDNAITAVAHAIGGSLEEQLVAYEDAHATLQDRLADVEG
jgi:hypothetical protein